LVWYYAMSSTILVEKQTLEEILEENRKLRAEIIVLNRRVAYLEGELKTYKRKLFGKKSEKLPKDKSPSDQDLHTDLKLDDNDKAILKKLLEDHVEFKGNESPLGSLENKLPLERLEIDLKPHQKYCLHCSNQMHQMGEEVCNQIEYVEPSLKHRKIVRLKYACRHCELEVKVPKKPGRKGKVIKAGPGLLAYLIVAKYADHLPLYRLEGIFKRYGYRISRSTLCDWLKHATDVLASKVSTIKSEILKDHKIHTDDTTLPVQDRTLKGRTRTGRMWVYTNQSGCVYEYTSSRSREGPSRFLAGYNGIIQADGYAGYNECCEQNDIQRAACWAHVRRKFFDLSQLLTEAGKPHIALAYIQRLYRVEHEISGFSSEHKKQVRQLKAKPILTEFKMWLKRQLKELLPESLLVKAINYTLNFWNELELYCDYGYLDIDNNAAERAMRPVALGRKNWLFAGSDEGGKTAATMLSLIETAKQRGLNVISYIKDLLSEVNCDEIVGC
jgi:transposase